MFHYIGGFSIFVFNQLGLMSLLLHMHSWTPIYLLRESSLIFLEVCLMTTHILWRPHFSAICVDFIKISIRTVDISFRTVDTCNPKVCMDAMLYKIMISIITRGSCGLFLISHNDGRLLVILACIKSFVNVKCL